MVRFEGTCDEFNAHFGPKIRIIVAIMTKSKKNTLGNTCQRCHEVKSSLDAAHKHGIDRKTLMWKALEKYPKGDKGYVVDDIDKLFNEIKELHMPIEDVFMFLCKGCHKEYDDFGKQYTFSSKKPPKSPPLSSHSLPETLGKSEDLSKLTRQHYELTDKKDSCLPSSLSEKQKNLIPKRGDVFTEKELCAEFAVRNTGGIRPSTPNKCIVLIHSSYNPNIAVLEQYSDMVDENHGYLIYTGEGSGDQKMERNNKAILESFEAGRMMLYFDKPRQNYLEYQFRVCYDSHYWDTEKNSNGEDRKVIRFKLRISDD